MNIYQFKRDFVTNGLVKQITDRKFPNHDLGRIASKFIDFWFKKFKKYPEISDFIRLYGKVLIRESK